jgi:hypothetical protein
LADTVDLLIHWAARHSPWQVKSSSIYARQSKGIMSAHLHGLMLRFYSMKTYTLYSMFLNLISQITQIQLIDGLAKKCLGLHETRKRISVKF